MVLVLGGIQFVVVGLEVVHFCLVYFYKWDIKDMKKGTILHWFMLSAVWGYAKTNYMLYNYSGIIIIIVIMMLF